MRNHKTAGFPSAEASVAAMVSHCAPVGVFAAVLNAAVGLRAGHVVLRCEWRGVFPSRPINMLVFRELRKLLCA